MRSRRLASALLVAAALSLLAPLAEAHCGQLPRPQDRRLLQDSNDECAVDGNDDNDCSGAYSVIALDVQERWMAGEEAVAFRLLLDEGEPGPKTVVLAFTGPRGPETMTWRASDDGVGPRWTNGGGFDAVAGPLPTGDGTRFYVEGSRARAELGSLGEPLSGFRVTSRAGTAVGDVMPGGCTNRAGPCAAGPAGDPCVYDPPSPYRLRGAGYYAEVEPSAFRDVPAGGTARLELTVRNLLATPQSATVALRADEGVRARFEQADGAATEAAATLHLQAGASATVVALVEGLRDGATGDLAWTLDSDLGGHETGAVGFAVVDASSPPPSPGPTGTDPRGAPALPVGAILLAAAAAALARRSAA